ncbi:WD repeat-containing protein 55 homolog [Galendromus occidentalis]|uniref:WD repeat-containing protein 55 homolog n=1 Tax=Galendromus occidentalis TaxID=34638 RepID=A0AAJ6QQM6_9ACAR|nr:WD repeat-containing protein 55 homolog [Galendromus occidentalis]
MSPMKETSPPAKKRRAEEETVEEEEGERSKDDEGEDDWESEDEVDEDVDVVDEDSEDEEDSDDGESDTPTPAEDAFDEDHDVPPPLNLESNPCCLSMHPSEDLVALGTIEGEIMVYNYSTQGNTLKSKVKAHKKASRGIKYNADGKLLFSISKDKSIKVIDAEEMKTVSDIKNAHLSSLYAFSFIDDWLFATGDEDGAVRIWDHRTSDKSPVHEFKESEDYIADLLIEPEKKKVLLAASAEGTLTAFDIRKKKTIMQSEVFDEEFLSLALVKDKKIVCGGSDGSFEIFNWEEFGYIVNAMKSISKASIDSMVALSDSVVVYGCGDGNIRAANFFPNKPLGIIGKHSEFPVLTIAADREKKLVASTSGEPFVKFWSVEGLEEKASMKRGKGQDLKMAMNTKKNNFFAGLLDDPAD